MRNVLAALAGLMLAAGPAHAQDSTIPRTPEGRPDFQGVWLSGIITQLERPDGFDALIIPPAEAPAAIAKLLEYVSEGEVYDPEFDYDALPIALLEINGELRSSQIIEPADGKLPLTSLASTVIDNFKRGYDDPEARPGTERCVDGLANAPLSASFLLIPTQIVQTPGAVVFVAEDTEAARIVSLSGGSWPVALRTRNGQSRGRWEGDTLVVETDRIDITGPTGLAFRGGAIVTSDSRVIERIRLISTDALLYQFTIEDPSLYNRPWRAEYVMKRTSYDLFEYACHEANHALTHILAAARVGNQEK